MIDTDNYENYHSHKMFTNVIIADSPMKYEAYINRAIELNQSVITSVEHGFQGNYWLLNELIENKNKELKERRDKGEANVPKDLQFIFGTEAYWVRDRHEKDKSNCHMILLAKNENGRRKINLALSKANEDGMFNGRPRLDFELLFELPKNDIFVTSACLFYWNKYEDIDEITIKLHNYFRNNFLLEVQNHNTEPQKKLNRHILELSKKYNIKTIAGMDTHLIDSIKDNLKRDKILEYKGIKYEGEEGWYIDYPSYSTAFKRFQEQGVLSDEEIYEALNNTNIIKTFGGYNLNREIKLPTLYLDKTQNEKDILFKNIINEEWIKFKNKEHIKNEEIPTYLKGIRYEVEEVIKTEMTDYFLLHYVGLKKGVENGGLITKRGRGCFTEDALVHTEKTIKSIKDIEIGDKVITRNGRFNRVLDKMSYNICEEMIQIKHLYGTDTYNPMICTLDHKIYVNRDNNLQWVKASDLKISDYVCVPKIKIDQYIPTIIDLNDYNIFGYAYDNEYIYEIPKTVGTKYDYSPNEVAKKIGISENLAKNFSNINCKKNLFKRKPEKLKEFMNYIPFNTREEYCEYVKSKRIKKITRFINLDFEFNTFIGLMYGDGFTNNHDYEIPMAIGLAINNQTKKDNYNRKIFYNIAQRLNLSVYENKSKTKKLSQLFINSKILGNFIKNELFISNKKNEKQFNSKWFYQPIDNLNGLIAGLFYSDGSYDENKRRLSFDNTSKSLINAYKLLSLMTDNGIYTLHYRKATVRDNYKCKESFKLRKTLKMKNTRKIRMEQDDNFYYLPITEIKKIPKQETIVYDITVENEHNYLLNNMIVHNSGVGFFINTLLGFSKVDRFKAPIKLYPERFLTADRILKSKSLPDIDNNIDRQEPFVNAFKELLGEHGIYPMLAFGALKTSSAIKLYMGAEGIDASIQNEVSKQLQEYDESVKRCDTDEEKDAIDITKYITKEYIHYVDDSKPYQGIVVQKSAHPCAFILLNGDIREEIGLFRCESKSTKKSVLTACIEGTMADHYKYLKTDLLIVDVVGITDAIWERIGLPSPTNNELERLLASTDGEKAWEMYAKGYTLCINQCEKDGTKHKCMKYKMRSTAELSAFVAAIRPAFGSLLSNFLERKPYTTGVTQLDEVLKDSYHYMMYQESIMAYLNWLGIDMKETYDIVKKISKKIYSKHPEQMEELKNKCRPQWMNNVGDIKGFEETWKVMNDAGFYAFNSAHSYCVGNDGAEIAYTKAYYPYETYEVCLNWFDKKKNKEKVSALKEEMKIAFGIIEGELRFGLDNRKFTFDKENKCINPSLSSIKSMGKNVAEELYAFSQAKYFGSFYELLKEMTNNSSIDKSMIVLLIKLDYFRDFGKSQKILDFVGYFNLLEGKKAPKKATMAEKIKDENIINIIQNNSCPTAATYTKFDSEKCLNDIWEYIPNNAVNAYNMIINRKEILGYVDYKNDKLNKRYVLASDINTKYSPTINTYCFNSGISCRCKIAKKVWNNEPIQENDIIFIHAMEHKFGYKKIGDKMDKRGKIKPVFEADESKMEWWITEYSVINNISEVLNGIV